MARWILGFSLTLAVLVPIAVAQGPRSPVAIQWTTFVGGGDRDPRTAVVGDEPGRIDMGDSPWRCGYARVREAQVSARDWSAQRVLACQRGEGTVSSTATCRVRGGVVEERAATLSLGTVGRPDYVTVTLGCRARP